MDKEIIDTEEKEPLDIKEQEETKGIWARIKPTPFLIVGVLALCIALMSPMQSSSCEYCIGAGSGPLITVLLSCLGISILILDRFLVRKFEYKWVCLSEIGVILMFFSPL